VLSLSLHFTEASEQILFYLQNIEEKLKSDIPNEVKEKIQKGNEKAKVCILCPRKFYNKKSIIIYIHK